MSATVTPAQIQIQLPPPEVPFTDRRGYLMREWRYVLIGLLQRTGGGSGGDFATLQGEINDLGVLVGVDSVPPPGAAFPDPLTAMLAMPPAVPAALNPFNPTMIPPPDRVIFDQAVLLAQAIQVPE